MNEAIVLAAELRARDVAVGARRAARARDPLPPPLPAGRDGARVLRRTRSTRGRARGSPGCSARCDVLARLSMERVLVPLKREVPPVLTYVDKGLGASILRAGLRLWDGGSLSRPRRDQDHPAEPAHADGADPRERPSGRAHRRLERGARGRVRTRAAGRRRRRSGRRGPPRSPPTRTRSCTPATARSPRCTTSSRAGRPSSGTSPATRTRSRTCACS